MLDLSKAEVLLDSREDGRFHHIARMGIRLDSAVSVDKHLWNVDRGFQKQVARDLKERIWRHVYGDLSEPIRKLLFWPVPHVQLDQYKEIVELRNQLSNLILNPKL